MSIFQRMWNPIIETDEEESRHCALIQVATVDNEVSKGIIFFYF